MSEKSEQLVLPVHFHPNPNHPMQGKHWCFTLYNNVGDFIVDQSHKNFLYAVAQKEICPSTKKVHWQGYIEYSRNMRQKAIQKHLGDPKMHVELRRGSRAQARQYCMKLDSRVKDTEPLEFGVWKEEEQGKRNDLLEFATDVRAGKRDYELAEAHPVAFLKFSKHAHALRAAVKPVLKEPPKVIIIWGQPDKGKTRRIYDNHPPETVFKMEPRYRWFDTYEGQEVALFDEYNCQFKMSFLLQLLDRYPLNVEIKGAFAVWSPKIIYFTSNFNFDDWYPNVPAVSKAALRRRVTEIIEVLE